MLQIPYYNPELSRSSLEPTPEAVQGALHMLDSPRLTQEIKQGNISFAMIRPNVGPEANIEKLPDQEAADRIETMIQGLGFVAKFSFRFDKEATKEFYGGGPEESMSKEPPQDKESYASRWPEFVHFMTSGNSTGILLHNPDGDAIARWRAHLGHWNIDQVRDPSTIRGKFGVSKYNNLVHGSDSSASVVREIDIIKDCLRRTLAKEDA